MYPKDFKIAVCDDDREVCILVKEIICNYGLATGRRFTVDMFLTTEELYQHLSSDHLYDFLFLDILFKDQKWDGIDLGILIREKLKDSLVDIVYLSSCRSRLEDMFDAHPKRFICKPVAEEKVIKTLELLIQEYENHTKAFFEYHVGGYTYRVDIHDIIYLWINKREIHIKTVYKDDYFIGKIGESFEKLKDYNFVMANKSCIINYFFISDLSKKEVILSTGEVIKFNDRCYRLLDVLHRKKRNRYETVLFENMNWKKGHSFKAGDAE